MTEPATTDDPQVAYEIAQQRIEEAERTGATELELHDLPLTELPPEIGRLSRLEKLFLGAKVYWRETSKVRLTNLPPEIGQLTNLVSLSLRQNKLLQLPPEIGQLTNLQLLYLMERRGRLPDLYETLANDRPHLFDHAERGHALRHRPQVYR